MMRGTTRQFGLLVGLGALLALSASAAHAQQEQQAGQQGTASGESTSAGQMPKPVLQEQPRYVLLLGSDQVVALNEQVRHRFIYGMSLSEGYDDGIMPGVTPTGVVYTAFNPRIGLLGTKPRLQYAIQYAPSLGYFSRSVIGFRANHDLGVQVHGEFNRGLGWDFALEGRYGSYAADLLSPFRFNAINGVVVTDPGRIILDTIGNRLDTQANLGLHWRPSERTTVSIGSSHSYAAGYPTDGLGINGHLNRDAMALTVNHQITRHVGVVAVADGTYSFGTAPACVRYGGSLGLDLHPTRRLDLFGAAGPEFGNSSCIGTRIVAYHGFASYRLTRFWTVYGAGERSGSAPVRVTNVVPLNAVRDQITQTALAGISRRAVGGRLDLRLDFGYLDTQYGLGGPITVQKGKYVAPLAGWRFTPTLSAYATYHRVFQSITGLSQDRNQFAITVEWRPDNPERGRP